MRYLIKALCYFGASNVSPVVLFRAIRIIKILYNLMSDKGFIDKKLTKRVSKQLDKDIKLGKVVELFDGVLIHAALNYLDNTFGDRLPERAKRAILLLLTSYVEQNWEAITDEVVETANELIDIPLLDEEFEANFFRSIVDTVLKFIKAKRDEAKDTI